MKHKVGAYGAINDEAYDLDNEAFELFKSLYNYAAGDIIETDGLVEVHTGGWSENEVLVLEFQATWWWAKYHEITKKGGHYYFDMSGGKEWQVVAY